VAEKVEYVGFPSTVNEISIICKYCVIIIINYNISKDKSGEFHYFETLHFFANDLLS